MQRLEEIYLAGNVPQISQLSPITSTREKKGKGKLKSHIRDKRTQQETMTRRDLTMDLPFILIQHQVAENVFADSVEGFDDFERLGVRELFCT